MSRLADRMSAMRGTNRGLALGIAIMCAASLQGQAPASAPPAKPPAPATFSGCVQKAPGSGNMLVINAANACAILKGSLADDKLAGHQIQLKGVLTPRTAATAASIQVSSVTSVGNSCSDVCSLQPPRSRGLHPPDQVIPGSEAGTPGLSAPAPNSNDR
jgi:hypothetical protein